MLAGPRAEVLLVTVTKVESEAVRAAFAKARAPKPESIGGRIYFDLGEVNGARVWLTQSEMGSGGVGASQQAVEKSIAALSPVAVVMVGIAFGVSEEKQAIGDVLITETLRLYELQRVGSADGTPKIVLRGDRPHASPWLINHLRSAESEWKEARVRFGTILTGEKLIDDLDFRDQLRALEPESIGGEMEGAGLYVTCHDRKIDWILVKGICDWADGQKAKDKERRQELAARNAASFVAHALRFVRVDWRAQRQTSRGVSHVVVLGASAVLVLALVVTFWIHSNSSPAPSDEGSHSLLRTTAPPMNRRVRFEGHVRYRDDAMAVAGAQVNFLGVDCPSTITDARGNFYAVDCVGLDFSDQAAAQIVLPNRSLPCNEVFPLSLHPASNILTIDVETCTLAPVEELGKARLTFLELNGALVDLLINGQIAQGLNVEQHRWISLRTPTLEYLEQIYNQHKIASHHSSQDDGMAYRIGSGKNFWPMGRRSSPLKALRALPRLSLTEFIGEYDEERLSATVEIADFRAMIQRGGWNPIETDGSLAFWGYADANILARLHHQTLLDIVGVGLPRELLVAVIAPTEELGCAGHPEGSLLMKVEPRYLSVSVLLIENISSEPIGIGEMKTRLNGEMRARPRSDDEARLADVRPASQIFFGPRQLPAGDALVLPLHVRLKHTAHGEEVGRTIQNARRLEAKELDALRKVGRYEIDFHDVPWAQDAPPQTTRAYIMGPSLTADEIQIDGVHYKIRPQDGASFYFQENIPGRSCPFVFAAYPGSPTSTYRGAILVGHVGKAKEGIDVLEVEDFTGTVSLREVEFETSYIDEVYFVAAGETLPRRPLGGGVLQQRDGDYQILERGDAVDVKFGSWPEEFRAASMPTVTMFL